MLHPLFYALPIDSASTPLTTPTPRRRNSASLAPLVQLHRPLRKWAKTAKFKRTLTSASVPAAAFSLQSLTQRFCRLPCLFIADVGVADRADILMAEEFLDFPQILSHLVEQDCGCGVAQSVRGDLPDPEGYTGRPEPQIERTVGERRARISRKHKLRGREGNPVGSQDAAAFKALLEGLPIEPPRSSARDRHILEDAPLAFDPEGDNFLPHPLAIAPRELDQLEPAGGALAKWNARARAISLLPGFEIVSFAA